MRRKLILALLLSVLTGCGTLWGFADAPAKARGPYSGQRINATVGSEVLSWETGSKFGWGDTAIKRELVYLGHENRNISIGYREYYYDKNQYGWMARPAFSEPLKFDVAPGAQFTFREVVFKVLGYDSNRIDLELVKPPAEIQG